MGNQSTPLEGQAGRAALSCGLGPRPGRARRGASCVCFPLGVSSPIAVGSEAESAVTQHHDYTVLAQVTFSVF